MDFNIHSTYVFWWLFSQFPIVGLKVYILEQASSQCLLSTLLNCFDLVYFSRLGHLGRSGIATGTIQRQIVTQTTSQEEIVCSKAKELLRSYCLNIYTVHQGFSSITLLRLWRLQSGYSQSLIYGICWSSFKSLKSLLNKACIQSQRTS